MKVVEGLLFFITTFGLSQCFVPEIQMPYKAISGTSITEINIVNSTLTCDEQRNSLQACATECYDRSLTTTGCPGFCTDTTQSDICHLCHVSNTTEIQANYYTIFGNNDKLYLLKQEPVNPDVSMDFDNYTGDTINGVNVVGTASGIVESDHVVGIKGEGLYLHGGGKVALTGSSSECWTNLDHCTSGMTVSIWFKPTQETQEAIPVGSGVSGQKGFNFHCDPNLGPVRFIVFKRTLWYEAWSAHGFSLSEWYLLTGTYNGSEHVAIYVNGVKGNHMIPKSTSSVDSDWRAHIGVRDASPYSDKPINGYVDEFKYYYKELNPVEIWREYVGYDLDLDRHSVIPAPGLVSNDNDYSELMDGNLATCVLINPTSCSVGLKVKLWNSASDKRNYTVTIITENMECDHKGFMVYGGQDIPENLSSGTNENRMHFLGNSKMLILESTVVQNEQNECVFRHICEDACYYAFISVQNILDEGSRKICEVKFK